MKDDVGRPKPNTRRLPNEKFSFGMAIPRDIEDTGQGMNPQSHPFQTNLIMFLLYIILTVTSKWQYSRESQLPNQDKDFKRLNKSALSSRATTAHVSRFNCPDDDLTAAHQNCSVTLAFSVNTSSASSRTLGSDTRLKSVRPC